MYKRQIEKIQSLVRRASQYNYAVDVTYDEIDLKCEPTNAVFLSMNEITRIYYYKFERQDKRKAKERIRDMFILGCLTALRYSDYSRLTSQNLINGYIVIRTKKTNVDVKVPAHDYVKEIYAKYGGFIPRGLCIQYVNKYLKVIMKEIGLNDLVTYSCLLYTSAPGSLFKYFPDEVSEEYSFKWLLLTEVINIVLSRMAGRDRL